MAAAMDELERGSGGFVDRSVERISKQFDRHAAGYDRMMGIMERFLFRGSRHWVAAQATGDVLEIAIGTGLNLPHYPERVRVTGIDVSAAMLEVAARRAERIGRKIDLRHADAHALPFADDSFDTVVSTLSLCTIPDPDVAVHEVRRVLRPRGRMLLLEHVRSSNRAVRGVQRALEPLAHRFEGDHLLREPVDYLESAGFEVVQLHRSKAGIMERAVAMAPS